MIPICMMSSRMDFSPCFYKEFTDFVKEAINQETYSLIVHSRRYEDSYRGPDDPTIYTSYDDPKYNKVVISEPDIYGKGTFSYSYPHMIFSYQYFARWGSNIGEYKYTSSGKGTYEIMEDCFVKLNFTGGRKNVVLEFPNYGSDMSPLYRYNMRITYNNPYREYEVQRVLADN